MGELVEVIVAVEVAVLPATVFVGVAVLVRVLVRVAVEVLPMGIAVLVAVGIAATGAVVKLRVHPEIIATIKRVIPARPCQICERFMFPSVLGSNCAHRKTQQLVGVSPRKLRVVV